MHPYTDVLLERGKKVAEWLLAQIDNEGSLLFTQRIVCLYKMRFSFCYGGAPRKERTCAWPDNETILHKRRDLMINEKTGKKTCEPYTSFFSQSYANHWVILGAQKLGQISTVNKLNSCILENFTMRKWAPCAVPAYLSLIAMIRPVRQRHTEFPL